MVISIKPVLFIVPVLPAVLTVLLPVLPGVFTVLRVVLLAVLQLAL